jgi:hypothetical protein
VLPTFRSLCAQPQTRVPLPMRATRHWCSSVRQPVCEREQAPHKWTFRVADSVLSVWARETPFFANYNSSLVWACVSAAMNASFWNMISFCLLKSCSDCDSNIPRICSNLAISASPEGEARLLILASACALCFAHSVLCVWPRRHAHFLNIPYCI